MKVLLIDPPFVQANLWEKVGSVLPSLGLAYIAAVLEDNGHIVQIIDCTAERVSVEDIKEYLVNKGFMPDYVGITATTQIFPNAIKIASVCKKLFNCMIVMGGVHPTVNTDEVLEYDFVDFIVRDEGEETMKELLSGKDPFEIEGLSFKCMGNTYHNPLRPLIKDVNSIPLPAYHLLPIDKYRPAVGNYKRLPAMSMFATRGCPGRCTFCHRTFRGCVRLRSAENIIQEVKLLQKDYGIKEINFYDDTFTMFKKVVHEFCDIIINEKIDLTWSCFTRVDHVDEPLLTHMKQAGCHLILFGVESADETILKNINKNIDLEQVKEIVRVCRKIGVETRASFMLMLPGDTEETMMKTINFAIELDPDEVQFNITTVYPGTEMYNWALNEGYIKTFNWEKYGMSDVVWELPSVDINTVRRYYSLAHRKFYLRPKVILRRLMKIRSLEQLKQELAGARAVVGI